MYKSKKILINENEKNHILGLYGLINEQTDIKKEFRLDKGIYFEDGKWKNIPSDVIQKFIQQFSSIESYLRTINKGRIKVKILSSESQVPNYDKESGTSKPVPKKYLSEKRANTLKTFIENNLNLLVEKNLVVPPIEFDIQTLVGNEPYTKGVDDPKDEKYNKDRYVKVNILVEAPHNCLLNLGIVVLYEPTQSTDPRFACRGKHRCNRAKFDVLMNGVYLGVADLNNERFGERKTFSHQLTEEEAVLIHQKNPNEINVSLKCKQEDCHNTAPEMIIYKIIDNRKVSMWNGCTYAMGTTGSDGETTVLKLDGCGRFISTGTPIKQTDEKIQSPNETSKGSK